MTMEKPWKKPFDKFLEESTAHWGGAIQHPDEDSKLGFRAAPTSYFAYPRYSTEVRGVKVYVEISEMPFFGGGIIESLDNVEYLRLSVCVDSDFNVIIRHESFVDRWKKALKLDWEFQTGNEEFDRKYFMVADYRDNPQALREPSLQRRIVGMEPFDALQIGPRTLMWSQSITAKDQLTVAQVTPVIDRLIVFAEALKG